MASAHFTEHIETVLITGFKSLPGLKGLIAAYIWHNPSSSNSHPHRICNFRTLSSGSDSNVDDQYSQLKRFIVRDLTDWANENWGPIQDYLLHIRTALFYYRHLKSYKDQTWYRYQWSQKLCTLKFLAVSSSSQFDRALPTVGQIMSSVWQLLVCVGQPFCILWKHKFQSKQSRASRDTAAPVTCANALHLWGACDSLASDQPDWIRCALLMLVLSVLVPSCGHATAFRFLCFVWNSFSSIICFSVEIIYIPLNLA